MQGEMLGGWLLSVYVDTETLVSAEHLLRKIDAAVDFNMIYDTVKDLYETKPIL